MPLSCDLPPTKKYVDYVSTYTTISGTPQLKQIIIKTLPQQTLCKFIPVTLLSPHIINS